ncbi:hypothetical protein DFH08DRAFT_711660 [Mycena albidolilacea]|uniref:Uncharacterized protein n=1 Tax=Mycena albidolilacea TaxID=1033008 RepID=A0AAD6ZJ00_9AGAR|nr:hypothetical protein DFH08DRAFT_711660 [Mycena albidolilacea]
MALEFFGRQFCTLFVKNWIVFSKHPIINLLRCLVLPVAARVFLAEAQQFLTRPSDVSSSEPAAVRAVQQEFKAGKLVCVDATAGNSEPSPTSIMAHITNDFSASQMNALKKVSTVDQLLDECPQNFNGFSGSYAGVVFNDTPRNNASVPITYTIMGHSGRTTLQSSVPWETRGIGLTGIAEARTWPGICCTINSDDNWFLGRPPYLTSRPRPRRSHVAGHTSTATVTSWIEGY